ncbi:3-hydroxyisobutyrate dehydrogenase and related beta-hydroxyacid dehydrogenase [Candidatus Paraburkholderia calva]|nr:3-hydroxyisobutyrate dehydrogenase and related beta-hydroxyacid dehydrogenase [Candidatus Paraburkholderia calva]
MTETTIAVLGAGAMGSAIGRMTKEAGARVLTSLDGRGDANIARVRLHPVSIVPPGVAEQTAQRMAPALTQAARKPMYVDCNAISPETAAAIARVIEPTGAPFVDGGIIGAPSSLKFYMSGADAGRTLALNQRGLVVRVLEGPVGAGAASALKMSYAGITKGLTAFGSTMSLAALRNGAGDALMAELSESQPELAAWLTHNVPRMPPKAYRWVAEMEEIAAFIGADFPEHRIYEGAAALYARLARDKDATQALENEKYFGKYEWASNEGQARAADFSVIASKKRTARLLPA